MRRTVALVVVSMILVAACGDDSGSSSAEGSGSPSATLCDYYDLEGCTVFGLVLADPVPTADALAVAADLRGVPLAVWRTDLACVSAASTGPPGVSYGPETEPSRFAYVDAQKIRDRHLAASGSVAPPITGLSIFESYWRHYADQWNQAQRSGVLIEAIAVYLPDSSAETLAGDPRFTATSELESERSESTSLTYHGELTVYGFPDGYLSTPPDIVCE